ncbi:MAG TPA: hypothetical protein HA343_07340 [Methanomassiliicoccales archaeon]|nr:hypothetical protein [Methanomassiliicoccales archaeon]
MLPEERAVEIIKGMTGTRLAFLLSPEVIIAVQRIEDSIKSQIGLDVVNEGVIQCLRRQHVICVIKDARFRPPPEPTVLMMGDSDLVIGTEILPGQHTHYKEMDNICWLGDDFVVFTDKVPKTKEFFLMPPVSFPELEQVPGATNIVSCSPSPLGDLIIKNHYGLEDDPKLASILVGFDIS